MYNIVAQNVISYILVIYIVYFFIYVYTICNHLLMFFILQFKIYIILKTFQKFTWPNKNIIATHGLGISGLRFNKQNKRKKWTSNQSIDMQGKQNLTIILYLTCGYNTIYPTSYRILLKLIPAMIFVMMYTDINNKIIWYIFSTHRTSGLYRHRFALWCYLFSSNTIQYYLGNLQKYVANIPMVFLIILYSSNWCLTKPACAVTRLIKCHLFLEWYVVIF